MARRADEPNNEFGLPKLSLGTGKTLLAKRLPTILPPLTPAESLETTRIYSAMGLLRAGQPLMAVRPFRSPHHSVSDAGLVGGGSPPQPGEIRLAHKGVLFLDELPEFNRKTLEVLRQPLEEGSVTISRALRSTTFPAEFILVAAMNPCPCGYRSDPRRACTLHAAAGREVPEQDLRPAARPDRPARRGPRRPVHPARRVPPGPDLGRLPRRRSSQARARQAERFGRKGPRRQRPDDPAAGPQVSARSSPRPLSILKAAMEELGLSARAHDKVLRVARTIADLEGRRRRSSPSTSPRPSATARSTAASGRDR